MARVILSLGLRFFTAKSILRIIETCATQKEDRRGEADSFHETEYFLKICYSSSLKNMYQMAIFPVISQVYAFTAALLSII
jgi:hypothetical protein